LVQVTEEVEVKEGEVVEQQYLVRWADQSEGENEDEWVREEFVAQDLIDDYLLGMESCDAKALTDCKAIDGIMHYLVQVRI
jgi:hypothetical protein